MKKLLLFVLILFPFFGYAQDTSIPDTNFEQALIDQGIDTGTIDGKTPTAKISGVKRLDIGNRGIEDITGIEDFTNLVFLDCSFNKLTELDISKNIFLTDVFFGNNKLTNIDLTNNKNILFLSCGVNLLSNLDLSMQVKLTNLNVRENQLKSLDLTKNTELLTIFLLGNQLTKLDVSKNTKLTSIGCGENLITTLDLSNNKSLQVISCEENKLVTLNIKNGNNTKLQVLSFIDNPDLRCIQVDDKMYSDTNWVPAVKDATAFYSEDCSKTKIVIKPPEITATGNQTYCAGTSLKIAETISITTDPSEPETDALYIQISAGYNSSQDILTLSNPAAHPKIITSWDSAAGKLKLSSPTGIKIPYTDFEAAIKDIVYSNSSQNPSGTRNFSITIGQANFLPSTGHYYQFVSNIGISWSAAKTAAEALNYYGLKGYLATLLSLDEAKISGEQAEGAGWIGGSDAATEGVWKWVTGPEGLANGGTGITFWNGLANGFTTNFAFWNTNEPNQSGNEDYAHITASGIGIPGSWNDLQLNGDASGNYQPKGFIVEYGGMPGDPPLQISASTTITIPEITVITPGSRCGFGTVTLQASATAGLINWYADTFSTTILHTGNSYSPNLSTTTPFYVGIAGCTASRTLITATVYPTPIANSVIIPRKCDNNQDGILTFNTSDLERDLKNGQTNLTITYFDQDNNPLKDINGILITSPFPNSFSTKTQTIKAVLTDNSPLSCFDETNIAFIVDDLPEAFAVPAALTTACDDEINPLNQDGKFAFDTTVFEATLLGGQTGMIVKYFDENNDELASPLPNPFLTKTQKITARVENPLNTSCTAIATLNFVVNPLPIVNEITITQCDSDLVVDGKTLFNLTVNNDKISANYQNETFTYYTSLNGANNADPVDLISNELAFENTTETFMDIWSRVANTITGCHSVSKIKLVVPATNISPNYKIKIPPVCDDFLDVNGDNNSNNDKRDGITTFDMTASKAEIQNLLPKTDIYTINYYRNEADALAESNVIIDISNYRNIGYPNSQDIWIRIDSDLDNACYGIGPYLTLNVEVVPVANTVTIPRQCDDNSDRIFTFNTTSLETDVLKRQTNVTVTYFDQDNNPLKDANGVLITSPFPANFISTSQTIKAVVTNTTTQQCFDETTIVFIVDASPIANAISSTLTTACDDEANPADQDGQFAFDTTVFETTILGGQTGMIVKYFDANNDELDSPLPNPYITSTQEITARVENPLNMSCTAMTTLKFVVNPIPDIDLNKDGLSDELVCSNISTFFVTLTAGILDGSPTSNYNYMWAKNGISTGPNAPTLDVNTEGVYTVEVTNNSGCSAVRTIAVTASNVATIVSIDVVDLTDNNTITINVTGPGDYQYSLDEPNGFWQDSNFFNNVPAGVHVVYINDKKGCGFVDQEIIIVGTPKFFTPNGDGFNDFWSVKEVNETFNSKSIIYIFDRYGKLLKQWVPSLNQGWDGTFNGIPLPADDYWYTLKLEDGREKKGHFSLKR